MIRTTVLNVLHTVAGLAAATCLAFFLQSCEPLPTNPDDEQSTGWFGTSENLGEIESDINFGSSGSLPPSVDLTQFMPPIGDQGQYGTCVAWSVGYNLKTFLEGRDRNSSTSDLARESNQFSAHDLFKAIPSADKGADCNGTYFEAALDVMQSRGIARASVAPYTNLGNCSDGPLSAWNSDAANYKIDNYRKINVEPTKVEGSIVEIKKYLAAGRAVAFGAKLGGDFMGWNSSSVMTSDDVPYGGQHSYHAMIVVGYDNSKGPRGAFKVANSWGTSWGDNGFIWVDYNYFVADFCFAAFVAKNKPGPGYDPDSDNNGQVDNEDKKTGMELVAWELTDRNDPNSNNDLDRAITYNVFNAGTTTIPANKDWNIVYVYYNAYDANEFGILLYDTYTDDIGRRGENGPLSSGVGISGNWWNNVDIPGGASVAQAVFGSDQSSFKWGYRAPSSLNGEYYLVIIADGYDNIEENDETNNFYFFTNDNGDPIRITNGIIRQDFDGGRNAGGRSQNAVKNAHSPVSDKNLNTYKPEEIQKMLKHHQKTGELRRRVEQFKMAQNLKPKGF